MKTAHQFAAELLAGPDLPIWHFDPSRAGLDEERDTSISEPEVQKNDSSDGLTEEEVAEAKEEGCFMGEFLTIVGETGDDGEAITPDGLRLNWLAERSYREGGTGSHGRLYVIAHSSVWPVAAHELSAGEKAEALRKAIDRASEHHRLHGPRA